MINTEDRYPLESIQGGGESEITPQEAITLAIEEKTKDGLIEVAVYSQKQGLQVWVSQQQGAIVLSLIAYVVIFLGGLHYERSMADISVGMGITSISAISMVLVTKERKEK